MHDLGSRGWAAEMEAALLGGFIKVALPKFVEVVCDEYKLHKGVKRRIESLKKEVNMIVAAIDDEISEHGDGEHHLQHEVRTLSMSNLRELAYGIEDCMDHIMYEATLKRHSSLLDSSIRFRKTMLTDRRLAKKLKQLSELTKEEQERMQRYNSSLLGQQASPAAENNKMDEVSDPSTVSANLVGIDGPMADLLEQLEEETKEDAKKQKVIAIVGFCGMGKTALAAKVYNSQVATGSSSSSSSFKKHAWVSAADKRPEEVLTQLLHRLFTPGAGSSRGTSVSPPDLTTLQERCKQHLMNKRYLVVIDDIRTVYLWREIKSAFPADDGISSRVIITTTFQQVANYCTCIKGYVHRMSRLDEECSKTLFCMQVSPTKELFSYNLNNPDSETISKRCRGQPLALVNVAEFMKTKGWPTDPECGNLCRDLKAYLQKDTTFDSMRRLLIRNYTSLRGHVLKSCLLYFAMFPTDHQIRKESLLRRWLAEGFMELHSDLSIAFQDLMDLNIIEPTCVSTSQRVKACGTYGLMHEFILHLSISQNFATLLSGEMTDKYIRRLSLHKTTATDGNNLEDKVLSLVRSLSVFGEANDTILDFSKYHLLRVLDLENCHNLRDHHLKNICGLLLLKYLSLGKNISTLPKDIKNLKVLQTLDLRGTDIQILPQEVLSMPGLINLFGRFMLPDELKPKSHDFFQQQKRNLKTEVRSLLGKFKLAAKVNPKSHDLLQQKESKLQTLAGFIADGKQDYVNLMGCMQNLKKVKVWCEPSEAAGTTNWTNLQEAIKQFIHDKKEPKTGDRSLSLHFSPCFGNSINSLEGSGYLSSLKLHGKLHVLPQFVTSLRGLEELCLGHKSARLEKGLLEALSKLGSLKYLKLIAKDLDNFKIKDGEFKPLLRLCFVLGHPTFPTIQKGSMPNLVTLQLLCKDIDGLCGIEMENLSKELKEIILDHGVNSEVKGKWEKAAKEHPNKPKVSSRITSLPGTTGNEESGTIDHGVGVAPEQSTNGSIDDGAAPEEWTSRAPEEWTRRASVQQSDSYSDYFSKILWCHELFAVLIQPRRGLCFMGIIMCVLVFLPLVGFQ